SKVVRKKVKTCKK
ncbi:Late transcription factor VLTF-4 (1), partial [Monkeypox virus]